MYFYTVIQYRSNIVYFMLLTLPKYQSDHTFCGLIQDSKELHEEFPFASHPVESHAKNKRPHDQAQCVGSLNILSHQSHFSGIL